MTSKTTAIAAISIVIILVVAFGAYSGKLNQTPPAQNINLPYQQGIQTNTQNTQAASSNCPAGQAPNAAGTCIPIGQVTVNLVIESGINSGTTYTTSNIAATYFSSSDGKNFAQIGSGSGNALTITPSMGGIFYMKLAPASGSQHYYIMPNQIMNPALNPSVSAFDFIDPTNSGTTKYWIFKVDLSKAYLPPISGGQTSPTLTLYVLADPYGALTMNSYTTVITSQAQGSLQPATVQYYGSLASTQEANAISEIDMKMNSTTTSKWDTGSYIQVPNVGNIYLNQMIPSSDGTNSYYKYFFNHAIDTSFGVAGSGQAPNFAGADYVIVGATGANSVPFTFNLNTNYGSTDKIKYTMTVYSLDDTQATQQSSKAVCVSATADTTCG